MSRRAGADSPYHRIVADVQRSQIRIGDTERESALTALSEHMTAGRLDIDEYGDRTARVSTAKTRGELMALFTDLPEPHPTFGAAKQQRTQQNQFGPSPWVPPSAPPPPDLPIPLGDRQLPMRHRIAASAVPMAAILALLLYITIAHVWFVFLIPAAVVLFGGAIWGDDWKHQRRLMREEQRRQIREIRRRGRGW